MGLVLSGLLVLGWMVYAAVRGLMTGVSGSKDRARLVWAVVLTIVFLGLLVGLLRRLGV